MKHGHQDGHHHNEGKTFCLPCLIGVCVMAIHVCLWFKSLKQDVHSGLSLSDTNQFLRREKTKKSRKNSKIVEQGAKSFAQMRFNQLWHKHYKSNAIGHS